MQSLRLLTAKEISALPDRDLAERIIADLAEHQGTNSVAIVELAWRMVRLSEEIA